jgi:hypothetical protein
METEEIAIAERFRRAQEGAVRTGEREPGMARCLRSGQTPFPPMISS